MPHIAVVPYCDSWPERFVREADLLRAALGDDVRLEHVGSTAVPGLAAKPVIDIVAAVHGELAEPQLRALHRLGYVSRSRAGTARRHFRKGTPRTHYLHVVAVGGPDWHEYVLLRDFLRTHAAQRDAYARAKQDLADATPGSYAAAKRQFLRELRATPEYVAFARAAVAAEAASQR
jgi:GrpB-like predicted nucleotidyltransferase (UPF0157 family)